MQTLLELNASHVMQSLPDVIMHAGGVIRDAPLAKQTAAALREVMAPKQHASARLASTAWALPLSADVGFSSLSALLGTAGQANYAAANLMLNAHAEERQSQGSAFHQSFIYVRQVGCFFNML